MKYITVIRAIVFAGATALLGACSNMQEVRDFSSESARLAGYTGVVDYTLGGYGRSEAYLLPDIRESEKKADAARQGVRDSWLGLHKITSAYMTTLARLAGADTFSIDASVGKLGTSIKESPAMGLNGETVDAYGNLVHIVSKWMLSGVQQQAVKKFIREGGGDFEQVVTGMGDVVRILRKIHDNEKKTVLHSLEVMIATTRDTPENYLILALARDRLNEKRAFYARNEALYETAAKGIQAVRDGHHTLYENLDRLDAREVLDRLKKFRQDIESVRGTLAQAGM